MVVRLGSFLLDAPLGEGAMAKVWSAHHHQTGRPVAIKVLAPQHLIYDVHRRSFRREIELVARLQHPAVARLYDHGEVTVEAARDSEGELAPSSPYLVMERLDGGSLDHAEPPRSWVELEAMLVTILSGLAHAHSREVIHRDLKPANVLLTASGSLKLADFGLAHEGGIDPSQIGASGTPSFMAPEQFMGSLHDQGPWTDLYALGCLAYVLGAGRHAFDAESLVGLAHAHLHEPPAPFVPRFEVPHGFESWLRVLLAKDPSKRFATAADAHYALSSLSSRFPASIRAATRRTRGDTMTMPAIDLARLDTEPPPRPGNTHVEPSAPPVPDHWALPHEEPNSGDAGLGVGPSLFGLRRAPFAGRVPERDQLWEALRRVDRQRRTRAVVIRGVEGTGKTRLGTWLAERAAELGAATVWRAHHSQEGGAGDGLVAMLARHLRTPGLEGEDLEQRIAKVLGRHQPPEPYLVNAIAELLAEGEAAAGEMGAKSDERLRTLVRLFEILALDRPALLFIDDAQWGLDAVRLAIELIDEARDESPILVVATLREGALVPGSLESQAVANLLARSATEVLELTELDAEAHRHLVASLVSLDGGLVERIVQRTRGNPLFAVQLIGDWVQRDLLVATGAGFELRAEGGEELPDDVRAICQARLRRALGEHAEHDGLALELAALLGAQIDETEWRSCCEASGLDPSPDLLESLGRQGLLDPALGTWRFAHGVVRESLLLGLSQAGREAAHHRLIADVLRNLYRERTPDVTERIAHHHEGGGELHDAQALLLRAASGRRLQGEYERAVELMRHREALLDRLGIAAADPLRAEGDLAMAKLDLDCDRLDEAARRADDVEHRAADQGWTNLAARATLRRAEVSLVRLEHPEALALFGRALQALDALGDLRGQIEARAGMAEAHYYLGNRDQAAEAYEENLRIAQQLGDELTAAEAHWGLGYVMLWQGRLERAHHHLDAMRELLTRRGGAYRLADAYNGLGEVARLSGRLAEAERFYREALRLNDAFGTRGVLIRRINILLCRIERDAPEVVEVELLDVLREADRLDNASVATMALAALLRCLAMRQAWDEAPPFLARFVAHQEQRPFIDGDLATNLSYVARLAAQAGRSREAETAVGYAREIWTKLGRHAELRALADL